MNKKFVKITSQFGHEIMALNFAKAMGLPVVILPKKETAEEFKQESEKIYANLSPFYNNMVVVEFDEKEVYDALAWDVIDEVKARTIDPRLWNEFAASKLIAADETNTTEYAGLEGKDNVLLVPQKLVTDGECGATASEQSLSPEMFNFFKEMASEKKLNLVLGQHFNKVDDLPAVKKLQEDFDMYVPGMTENEHVFGIRGVQHKEYYNMYDSLAMSVGIAGTHTWILLTMFPHIPQIILHNDKCVENWEEIAEAYRDQGYDIYSIGFNKETDMEALSELVGKACGDLLP